MRSKFPEFFALSEAEYQTLWDEAYIVLDTNVLLRLFRYKENTANEILGTLESLSNRIWLPYQVAWEYNRRRLEKIQESNRFYNSIVDAFRRASDNADKNLHDHKDFGVHPTINLDTKIKMLSESVKNSIQEIIEEYKSNSTTTYYNSVHGRIADLYEGNIGDEPTSDEIEETIKVAESRYAKRIPPGTRDVEEKRKRGQSDREVYGDYFIWKEMIEFSKSKSKAIIFVTEDAKDDWWLREDGQTIGPLPELRREFIRETDNIVHFYRLEGFLKQAQSRTDTKLSKESVEEVKERSDIDELKLRIYEARKRLSAVMEKDAETPQISRPQVVRNALIDIIPSAPTTEIEDLRQKISFYQSVVSNLLEEIDTLEAHKANVSSSHTSDLTNSERMQEYVYTTDFIKRKRIECDSAKARLYELERRLAFILAAVDRPPLDSGE